MTAEVAMQTVKGLPREQRVDMFYALRDQLLEEGWEPEIDDELDEELERRWQNLKANPESGMTPDEVAAFARSRR